MSSPLNTTIHDLLPLFERIAAAQERLVTAQEAIASCEIRKVTRKPAFEGFQDCERVIYCDIESGNRDGWYRLQDESAITQQSAFCGRVVSLEFNRAMRRDEEICQLYIRMEANGRLVKFESRAQSMFSKSILAAFATTTPEVLDQRIELQTYIKKLNSGANTLMVAVLDSKGSEINCDWSNDSPWREIAVAAKDNVTAAVALRS